MIDINWGKANLSDALPSLLAHDNDSFLKRTYITVAIITVNKHFLPVFRIMLSRAKHILNLSLAKTKSSEKCEKTESVTYKEVFQNSLDPISNQKGTSSDKNKSPAQNDQTDQTLEGQNRHLVNEETQERSIECMNGGYGSAEIQSFEDLFELKSPNSPYTLPQESSPDNPCTGTPAEEIIFAHGFIQEPEVGTLPENYMQVIYHISEPNISTFNQEIYENVEIPKGADLCTVPEGTLNESLQQIEIQDPHDFANVDIGAYLEEEVGMNIEVESTASRNASSPNINAQSESLPKGNNGLSDGFASIPLRPIEVLDHDYQSKAKAPNKKILAINNRQFGKPFTAVKRLKDGKTVSVERPSRILKKICKHTTVKPRSDRTYLCAQIKEEARQKQLDYLWSLPSWEAKQAYIKGKDQHFCLAPPYFFE